MKVKLYADKTLQYVKIILFVVLIIAEVITCVGAASAEPSRPAAIAAVTVSCVALVFAVVADGLFDWAFAVKIVFCCVQNALLFLICLFYNSQYSYLLFCIVLTQIYLNFGSFTDKLIIFAVSCALYAISYILGMALYSGGYEVFNRAVDMISQILLGLLVMALDFIVVKFLMGFYFTNKHLSEALKQAEDSKTRLKNAYGELAEAAIIRERNRIAKDMHDNAGHSMTTVIMQTEAAKLILDSDPEEARRRIISANIQARNALEQMRESVHLLAGRQGVTTLKEELEEILAQTADGTGVKIRCDIADIAASYPVRRFLRGALKECLSNGIRHGGATAFYVELNKSGNALTLYISDNGSGVEGQIVMGFGLSGLTKKAEAFGGACTLHSEKGEGMEVSITVPCDKEDKDD